MRTAEADDSEGLGWFCGRQKEQARTRYSSTTANADSRTRRGRTVHEKRRDHACPHCPVAFGAAGGGVLLL